MGSSDFGSANINQIEAITTTEGPVLIIAGPGTGKTFTLVKRTVYLIVEKKVSPESILICTFTEKAAKEIITRISNELLLMGISVNLKEMYIGTFHSICLRLLKENLEYTRLRKNYRILDQFEQSYLIFQNINKIRNIENYDFIFSNPTSSWKQSEKLAHYINIIHEELVDVEKMSIDCNDRIKAIANIVKYYDELLHEENVLDFSSIQVEAFRLLKENPSILNLLMDKIDYIMVDEYQDTNYVQEQIIFSLLSPSKNNICVVGDDDQGLYRFRGATIRNILEFPSKFKTSECKQIKLTINYRSTSEIIDFYNNWMETTESKGYTFKWDKYRYDKRIKPGKKSTCSSPSVIKVSGEDEDTWSQEILSFINELKDSGKVEDLNQIAFLFRSVKSDRVIKLARYLELNGINVYSPRSDMFFHRDEIRLAIGVLILIFPNYLQKLNSGDFQHLDNKLSLYYIDCIRYLYEKIKSNGWNNLLKWIQGKALLHIDLVENTNYSFSGLFYQMFEFEPFKSILSIEMNKGVIDTRLAHNLSKLSNILVRYEYLHRLDVFTTKNIDKHTEYFFNMYLKFLFDGGIREFEDDSEYAPSGCISFLTIHQSKGMEFPIVFVGSLNGVPRSDNDQILEIIQNNYYHREPYEPEEQIKYFDFWRAYYTAFSRAQNLLVLTAIEKKGRSKEPSKYFLSSYSALSTNNSPNFNIDDFEFERIKAVNIKQSYSFTSHILLFDNCSLQYKFYKDLGFTPVRVGSTLFGSLVHQTIEDIHKAALRNEIYLITEDNIETWFNSNYNSLVKKERSYLGEGQKKAALKQVISYAKRQSNNWDKIQNAEVEVSLVKENYILEGTIDLLKGEGDTVEIVDFKSEKKPDIVKEYDKIQKYKQQLEVYAHIVEKRMGKKVSKLHLYYTSETEGVPTITFPNNKFSIDNTILEFDNIVCKINNKDYSEKSKSDILCSNCDMRFYCK